MDTQPVAQPVRQQILYICGGQFAFFIFFFFFLFFFFLFFFENSILLTFKKFRLWSRQ